MTQDLASITTPTRRKIEEMLRAIRQGSRSLALLAAAAEVSIHENDHDAAAELESVYRQIQALQAEADAIARELKSCPMKSHHYTCDCNGEGGDR